MLKHLNPSKEPNLNKNIMKLLISKKFTKK